MKKTLTAILFAAVMIAAAACLAGCDSQQSELQEADKETIPSDGQSALQGVDKETIPSGGHEIYGISYAVPDTQWTYMFNADQLGDGEELIDLDISGGEAEKGLKAYWKEACESEEYHEDEYELKDSGEETVDGKVCYWYDKYDDGNGEATPFWRKVLLIPQTDGNKYVRISSDFIREADKRKADQFFRELLGGVEFADSKAFIVNEDYICAGGACISARGLHPTQLFYGLMDFADTGGLVSMQASVGSEGYEKGVDRIFEEMEWDEDSPLLDDGPLEIGGVRGKWYTWLDRLPDSMTYLSYCAMIPLDDRQEIVTLTYHFNGDVDDLSQYDDQIKELTEQIQFTKDK